MDMYESGASVDLISEWPLCRPSCGFEEQCALLTVWFGVWPTAERLVCVSALIDRMTDSQMVCVRSMLASRLQNRSDTVAQEAGANDSDVVYNEQTTVLHSVPGDTALATASYSSASVAVLGQWLVNLLHNLLLLSPAASSHCRSLYVQAVSRAVLAAMSASVHRSNSNNTNGAVADYEAANKRGQLLEQARQLLGVVAVHSALSEQEKSSLLPLYRQFSDVYTAHCSTTATVACCVTADNSRASSRHVSPVQDRLASPLTDRRRHSACASLGGSGGGCGLQDRLSPSGEMTAAGSAGNVFWFQRNLLSPNDASEHRAGRYLLSPLSDEGRCERIRSCSLTPPSAISSPGCDTALTRAGSSSVGGVRGNVGDSLATYPSVPALWSLHHYKSSTTPSPSPSSAVKAEDDTNTGRYYSSARQHSCTAALSHTHDSYPWNIGRVPARSASHHNLHDITSRRTSTAGDDGMTSLAKWMHKLRLHKYTRLLSGWSFSQLLQTSSDQLITLGLTRGGANKLLRHIDQLRHRQRTLLQLQHDVCCDRVTLSSALDILELLVVSPMLSAGDTDLRSSCSTTSAAVVGAPVICVTAVDERAAAARTDPSASVSLTDGRDADTATTTVTTDSVTADLPTLITQLLGRLCTQLLMSGGRAVAGTAVGTVTAASSCNVECGHRLSCLLDEAASRSCFSESQRRKLTIWKRQINDELTNNNNNNNNNNNISRLCWQRRHSDSRQYSQCQAGVSGTVSNTDSSLTNVSAASEFNMAPGSGLHALPSTQIPPHRALLLFSQQQQQQQQQQQTPNFMPHRPGTDDNLHQSTVQFSDPHLASGGGAGVGGGCMLDETDSKSHIDSICQSILEETFK